MNKIDLLQLNDPVVDLDDMSVKYNFGAKVLDMVNETIVEAVVDAARRAGVTHLYLLDERFVLGAIHEKIEKEGGYGIGQISEENDQLKAQNAELLEKIKRLERERDSAVADLGKARGCKTCKHITLPPEARPCRSCGICGKNYEWRGPCEENGGKVND